MHILFVLMKIVGEINRAGSLKKLKKKKKKDLYEQNIQLCYTLKWEVNYVKKVSPVVDFERSNLRLRWILKETIAHDRQNSRETRTSKIFSVASHLKKKLR